MKVLFALTSNDKMGITGDKTGLWLEELAGPYYLFKAAGAQITFASVKGGRPPIDANSVSERFATDDTRKFEADAEAQKLFDTTHRLSDVRQDDFDAIFYPGGHGPLWDLPFDSDSLRLIETFYEAGKVVALVCHSPAALVLAKRADGRPLVEGKRVTGFTNSEEASVNLTDVVPFLLEDELAKRGATFDGKADWQPNAVRDGNLITGQNPMSAVAAAKLVLEALQEHKKAA
jgi:putative intracellular protease/amidase